MRIISRYKLNRKNSKPFTRYPYKVVPFKFQTIEHSQEIECLIPGVYYRYMLKISTPTKKDYKQIVHLVNEADRVFFDIYTKNDTKEVGVGNLKEEELVSGEKTRKYLVLNDGNTILAFVSFRLKNEQTVWISSLYVRVGSQGKGYGSKLLREIEKFAVKNKAKIVVLETEKKAKWAVEFYLKNGYKKITKNGLAKFPFNKVLEKPPVPSRYILGKVIA